MFDAIVTSPFFFTSLKMYKGAKYEFIPVYTTYNVLICFSVVKCYVIVVLNQYILSILY